MRIGDLMTETGVKFGTSGARGRVEDMTDRVCYAYTQGFVRYLLASKGLADGAEVGLAGDYRASSRRILTACAKAVTDSGCQARYLGRIPTPALAAYGIAQGWPSIMVTGSHIPDDRNGIKFNLASGEILKQDEEGIRSQQVEIPASLFDTSGRFAAPSEVALPREDPSALEHYIARYLHFFPDDWLAGLRIGLYEHSSVARDALFRVLTGLGAAVERLGFSETFLPVDTEAIRPEDIALAREWTADSQLDALVSTDGDGDRPLVGDERGEWLRGDIVGVLCARALGAAGVVTPISSNTALERSGWFSETLRTRIGSPYVIAGMQTLSARGITPVVGYEANGGFLTNSEIDHEGRRLAALPTRDAVIVAVTVIGAARAKGVPVSALGAELPQRYTYSDRLKDFPTHLSAERLAAFRTGDQEADRAALEAVFGGEFGPVADVDHTDGIRATLANGDVFHLRPSGNAPELRAYTEAASVDRARELNQRCLAILEGWRD
ncbi:phosphomannomutase [Halochromatium glycolicum]|uniref:Phosphomannomutase n=1 Tax=Halochromatium glycolicum TaxID=85075 RepID=A0AAJ0X8P1_9GAMM|nr:phosphomannomutase [Halochromatium glycolicum]MBK1704076.1 phosphomannomutase [Halochromatium glycolicum]